jgi:hypothetical protein
MRFPEIIAPVDFVRIFRASRQKAIRVRKLRGLTTQWLILPDMAQGKKEIYREGMQVGILDPLVRAGMRGEEEAWRHKERRVAESEI